ncbi:unnamed protein product [Allacma fusca]|uniref:O-acyltransferase WSD1 C-terminal domain-containing protein n=1 Tax=Allacma fusca TaxID=39272 RepID=A0A8J2LA30_9HEXA|nr:unnamed protein product [Allacma fusca]
MDENSNRSSSEVNTALITCFDHVLLDGVSGINLMKQALGVQCALPNMKLSPPSGTIKERFLLWMKLPYDYLKLIESMRCQRQFAVNPECPQGYTASVSANIEVKLIKAIKTHYGVSYAAVLNSVVIGALHEILLRNNIPVPEFLTSEYVVPSPDKHPETMINHFHALPVRWHMRSNSAEERLYATHKKINDISNSAAPIAFYWYQQLQALLPAKLHVFMMSREDSGNLMNLSNFPVVDVHSNTNELRLCEMFVGHNPTPGSGICNLVAGINGNQRFVTFVDRGFIPNYDFAANFQFSIQGELARLEKTMKEYPAPSG